jgi:hypothetical protein
VSLEPRTPAFTVKKTLTKNTSDGTKKISAVVEKFSSIPSNLDV